MNSGLRRTFTIAIVVAVAWFGFVVAWAVRPQSDTVPVGIDYSVTPAVAVTSTVSCNGPFEARAVRGTLPTLKQQPPEAPALDFQRPPCELVQRNARIVFGLDVVFFLVLMAGAVAVFARRRRIDAALAPA